MFSWGRGQIAQAITIHGLEFLPNAGPWRLLAKEAESAAFEALPKIEAELQRTFLHQQVAFYRPEKT